ncbi:DUF2484 family protein [Gymnodinialimonas sp. 2305UL16-5]|uniref:DUF2484 family protein n=1 Tax=Gymnodinialimonas mytili TaxID=3126503 RepID=UPI0030A8E76B
MIPISLIMCCIWAVLACLAGLTPQRYHWPAAWTLIATGIPLLGWVTMQTGPLVGLIFLVAGASVLRWPLIRASQGLRRFVAAPPEDKAP